MFCCVCGKEDVVTWRICGLASSVSVRAVDSVVWGLGSLWTLCQQCLCGNVSVSAGCAIGLYQHGTWYSKPPRTSTHAKRQGDSARYINNRPGPTRPRAPRHPVAAQTSNRQRLCAVRTLEHARRRSAPAICAPCEHVTPRRHLSRTPASPYQTHTAWHTAAPHSMPDHRHATCKFGAEACVHRIRIAFAAQALPRAPPFSSMHVSTDRAPPASMHVSTDRAPGAAWRRLAPLGASPPLATSAPSPPLALAPRQPSTPVHARPCPSTPVHARPRPSTPVHARPRASMPHA